jgi:hypothetical protein
MFARGSVVGGSPTGRGRRVRSPVGGEKFITAPAEDAPVLPEWFALLPSWLVAGLGLGVVASLVVAGVFVVGDRLFPAPSGRESDRIDGTARRHAELRTYLNGIGERYLEDHPVHGDTVAFYLPERDVAITFDAQAYFRIERAGTYAVLCEHEMPGGHLGRRLPFDVPEQEPIASGSTHPAAAAFDRLGVTHTAGPDEVRSAYRSQVKQVHPDHGGDPEEFRRLQEAYATARDHAARQSAS